MTTDSSVPMSSFDDTIDVDETWVVPVVRMSVTKKNFKISIGNLLGLSKANTTAATDSSENARWTTVQGFIDKVTAVLFTRVNITDTTLTITPSHYGKRLVFMNGCIVTIPSTLPVDFEFEWVQLGTGVVAFVSVSGMTIDSSNGSTASEGQYATGGIWVDTAGHAILFGAI
jgi:hypothetical protein